MRGTLKFEVNRGINSILSISKFLVLIIILWLCRTDIFGSWEKGVWELFVVFLQLFKSLKLFK